MVTRLKFVYFVYCYLLFVFSLHWINDLPKCLSEVGVLNTDTIEFNCSAYCLYLHVTYNSNDLMSPILFLLHVYYIS